jgi:hypothetical protein
MKSLEKNDVDISRLFHWGDVLEINNLMGETVIRIYMRVIGDADVNRARVFALRKSAEMRKRLRDPKSDEHLAYLPDFDTVNKEDLVESLLLMRIKDVTSQSTRSLEFKIPLEPDVDASLEEQEKYQKEMDDWPDKVDKMLKKAITKSMDKERERCMALTEKELIKEYTQATIERLCENEMFSAFQDICVYFSCYRDKKYKTKMFKSVEEFQNLPSEIKEKIVDFYNSLAIDLESLKKLPEATQ